MVVAKELRARGLPELTRFAALAQFPLRRLSAPFAPQTSPMKTPLKKRKGRTASATCVAFVEAKSVVSSPVNLLGLEPELKLEP